VLSALLLAGCASVTAVDGQRYAVGSESFRAYAERVFRAQNAALSALAFAFDEPSLLPADFVRLEAAESGLIGACGALNEMAVRRRDEQAAGIGQGLEAARSVPGCERAVAIAEGALDRARR
jgi:hypothetical protein